MEQNKPHNASQKQSQCFVSMSVQPASLSNCIKKGIIFAGFNPSLGQVSSAARPCEAAEWLLLVDQTDQSHRRAVIIKNKQSGSFLAVQGGCLTGLTSYNKDCRWFLE